MRAIILSAGQGKRLHPLTAEIPKCLLPVRGEEPVLEVQLRALAACGVSEVALIGQDVAAWGKDLPDGKGLAELIRALDRVRGLRRIRLLYLHPAHLDDAAIESAAGSRNTVPSGPRTEISSPGRRSASSLVPFPLTSTRSSNVPTAGTPATENGRLSVCASDAATFTNCPGRGLGKSRPASSLSK